MFPTKEDDPREYGKRGCLLVYGICEPPAGGIVYKNMNESGDADECTDGLDELLPPGRVSSEERRLGTLKEKDLLQWFVTDRKLQTPGSELHVAELGHLDDDPKSHEDYIFTYVDHLFDGTGEFDPVMECVYADVVFEYARRTAVGPRPRVMVPYLCMLRTQDAKAFFQSRANLVLGDDGSHPDLRDIGIEMDGSDYVEMGAHAHGYLSVGSKFALRNKEAYTIVPHVKMK